jgi:hypothetical protein
VLQRRFFSVFGATLAVGAIVSAVALATGGTTHYQAGLSPIHHNPLADGHSSATGTASLDATGTQVHVVLHLRGLSPNLPHAMHIHGILAAQNECPPKTADTSGDGLISLEEGAPFYGPIDTSFTTSGDTSPASGLALERFPVSDANGDLDYDRTFTIPQNVIDSLGSLHIVVHGLDRDGDATGPVGGYDTLFEAVLPVACGSLSR